MADDRPWFLIVKGAPDPAMLSPHVERARGTVLAAAPQPVVEVLEPGTYHTPLLIARFAFREDLDSAWQAMREAAEGTTALASPGLPYEGWPGHEVPTIATVAVPASPDPRAYMLVEGSVTDEARIGAYRDIILPMLRERGAYYIQFELGGSIEILAGDWRQDILAVSRWPSLAAARDFWFCERYQTVAVPARSGAGTFEVQLTAGQAG